MTMPEKGWVWHGRSCVWLEPDNLQQIAVEVSDLARLSAFSAIWSGVLRLSLISRFADVGVQGHCLGTAHLFV